MLQSRNSEEPPAYGRPGLTGLHWGPNGRALALGLAALPPFLNAGLTHGRTLSGHHRAELRILVLNWLRQ